MKCETCGGAIAIRPAGQALPVPEENPFVVTPVRAPRIDPVVAPTTARSRAPSVEESGTDGFLARAAATRQRELSSQGAGALGALAVLGAKTAPSEALRSDVEAGVRHCRQGEAANGIQAIGDATSVFAGRAKGGALPAAKLALVVNDSPEVHAPSVERRAQHPALAVRRPVLVLPEPKPAPVPLRRHVVPIAIAVLVGIVLGGAFVGVVNLRDRPAVLARPSEPATASGAIARSPEPPRAVASPPAPHPQEIDVSAPHRRSRGASASGTHAVPPAAVAEAASAKPR
jgi:hypothetical protein